MASLTMKIYLSTYHNFCTGFTDFFCGQFSFGAFWIWYSQVSFFSSRLHITLNCRIFFTDKYTYLQLNFIQEKQQSSFIINLCLVFLCYHFIGIWEENLEILKIELWKSKIWTFK